MIYEKVNLRKICKIKKPDILLMLKILNMLMQKQFLYLLQIQILVKNTKKINLHIICLYEVGMKSLIVMIKYMKAY